MITRLPNNRRTAARTAGSSLVLVSLLGTVGAFARQPESDTPSPVQSFSVSQVSQVASIPPTLELHLALLDARGRQIRELEMPPTVDGSLGGEPILSSPLRPFSAEEGVGYVALVDVSASLSAATFESLQQALVRWIGGFSPADRLAVVAFGESARVLVDFTSDLTLAAREIESLEPSARLSVLHRGLVTALDLAKRSDADLPDRRAIVVLTDGRDEGSGLTTEDVLRRFETGSRFPIYAIGLSSLRGEERRRHLDVLLRLATASGGAYFEAGETDLAEAYERIGGLIREVWISRVECPRCRTDGAERHLDLRLRVGRRILSQGAPVRLLPGLGTTAYAVSAATTDPGGLPSAATADDRRLPLGLTAAALAAISALVVLWVLRRRGRGDGEPEPPSPRLTHRSGESASVERALPDRPAARPVRREPVLDGAGTIAAVPHAEPRRIRLDVVRGETKGARRSLLLADTLVVGRRSTCDLVLSEEVNLAPEQLALVQSGYRVLLEDRSDGGTLVNGRPPSEPQPIQSGDLVGNRDVILRVIFEV